ncbi:hypothetical protein A6R68_07393, partial [Neotoma lepida]
VHVSRIVAQIEDQYDDPYSRSDTADNVGSQASSYLLAKEHSVVGSKETKNKFKDPIAPKSPPSASLLVLSIAPKPKENTVAHLWVMLQREVWDNTAAYDKQPCEKKAAKLKEKYGKDVAAYRAKGKPDVAKKKGGGQEKKKVKAEKSKEKKEEEDEEDEEDEEVKEDED